MGQKVSPVGMRVGINRDWHSRWFASDNEFASFLHEDIKVRKYLKKELKDALLSHVEIERRKTDKGHDVTIMVFVARPGVVIGQEGANINRIKKEVSKLLKGSTVKLDVVEIKQPDLDAQLVAQWIATELENPLAYFFPSVIECPGVVCLTSNVNSDHQCRLFYLLNLRILLIIHFRDLQ